MKYIINFIFGLKNIYKKSKSKYNYMASNNYAAKYLKYKHKYADLQLNLMNRVLADETINVNMIGGDSSDNIDIMLFKADWCGYCNNFKPLWNQLQNEFNKKFNFITYDHATDQEIIKEMKINEYPTIMFKDGKEVQSYNGPREYDALQSILTNLVKIDTKEMTGGGSEKKEVLLFKAEWCGHCNNFKPTWKQLKNEFNKKFNFITYDHGNDQEMIKKMNIQGFPTIMFKTGDEYNSYNGSREYDELKSILTNL